MGVTRLRMDQLASVWLDRPGLPQQIAVLGLCDAEPFLGDDGVLDGARIRAEVAARAARIPVLRRRVLWTRPWQGPPVWVTDPGFDPASHIATVALPPGVELGTWASNRACRPLDRRQPLWRVEILDQIPQSPGQFGLLIVLHHLAADGLAGLTIARQLLDSGEVSGLEGDAAALPAPTCRELVVDQLHGSVAHLRSLFTWRAGRLTRALNALAAMRDARAAFPASVAETSLTRDVGPARQLVAVGRPLTPIRDAGHRLGATVNDLLLTAVAAGMRALLAARGDAVVPALVLYATVPVAVDPAAQAMGMLVIGLPVGEDDPVHQLSLVRAQTREGKQRLSKSYQGIEGVFHLPMPLARWLVRAGRDLGSQRVHLSVSNVVGPTQPLSLAGAEVAELVPIAPLVRYVALCVAALSYNDELVISANADASVVELDAFARGVNECLDALEDESQTPL